MLEGMLKIFTSSPEEAENAEKIISEVKDKIKKADQSLQHFHRQWFVNIAMRRGLQYVQYEPSSKTIINPPPESNRIRMVANRMNGIHQTRLAKLVKDLPRLENVPASSSEDAKDLARNGTKILDYVWQSQRVPEKLADMGSWALDCGSGFLFVYWDPTAGEDVPIFKRHEGPLTGQEPYKVDEEGFVLDETGERVIETMKTGDVVIDLCGPMDIVNDGVGTNELDSRWICVRKAEPIEDVKLRYGDKAKDVKEEKDLGDRIQYQKKLMNMSGINDTYASGENKSEEKLTTVYYYFEKKSEKYPKGRRLIFSGSSLLDSGELSLDGTKLPIFKFDDNSVSGSFWGLGTMEIVAPLQRGYNRTISQIQENAKHFANIKLKAPKGHEMLPEAYDDTGYEILEYDRDFEPTQLQPAEMPAYCLNLLSIYEKNFEDTTGMHEVTNGKVPEGVKSGRAIMALQEQDDTRLAPTKMKWLRTLERMGEYILELYAENQEVERTFQILGEDVFDIDELKISKAQIQAINKKVRVQTENLIAAHKEFQKEQVLELYNTGLLGNKDDPNVRKKVLQVMEFGSLNDLFSSLNQDTSQATQENHQFVTGEDLIAMPDPNLGIDPMGQPHQVFTIKAYDFQDHQIHIQEHDKFRKSKRYQQMPAFQRRGVDMHVEQHINFLTPKQPAPASMPPAPSPQGPRVPPPVENAGPMQAIGAQ